MPNKSSFEYVKEFIQNSGYTLLSTGYENTVNELTLECPEGHVFPMPLKVFRSGHRCPYCVGKKQYNIEEVRNILKEYGYELLSKEYRNNKQKLDMIGPDGVEYSATLFSIKVNGILPHIKNNKLRHENECKVIFDNITGKVFNKSKPEWLINPETGRSLELDGYCEELKMAFEYDGQFHFKDIHTDNLNIQFNRDNIKDKLCCDNGVRLIRIPFYIKDKSRYIYNEINSTKTLYIGDPHVTISNIDDSERLINFCMDICKRKNINHIVFLGDLFDTHGVVRLEVLCFWHNSIKKLMKQFKVTIIVGNHDMIMGQGSYAGVHSLISFKDKYAYNLNIIDEPTVLNQVGYMPYIHNEEDFLQKAQYLYENGATELLVCHQTFQGCAYENGFYAEDGFDVNKIPQKRIISGHIHKSQSIGKCFYTGTPKWDRSSDSGQSKGVWILDEKDGSMEFISTENVVTPMYTITLKEGEEIPDTPSRAKIVMELHGSSQWISKIKKQIKGKASIRSFPTDRRASKVDSSKLETIEDYADTFQFNGIVTKSDIVSYLKGLTYAN